MINFASGRSASSGRTTPYPYASSNNTHTHTPLHLLLRLQPDATCIHTRCRLERTLSDSNLSPTPKVRPRSDRERETVIDPRRGHGGDQMGEEVH